MKNFSVSGTDFVKALRIKERAEIYSKHNICNNSFSEYEKWVNTRGVITEQDIVEMLEAEGISSEEFNNGLKTLTEKEIQTVAEDVESADWFVLYKKIMEVYSGKMSEINIGSMPLDFGIAVLPFTIYSGELISSRINVMKKIHVAPEAMQKMIEKVTVTILNLSVKTLVWDFRSSISGQENDAENNELLQKYLRDNFMSLEGILSYYRKYPVIARRTAVKTKQVCEHFIEMLDRLEADYDEICKLLDVESITSLDTIDADQGDTHDKGKFVVKIRLSEGLIIYKPRNLKVQQTLDLTMRKIFANAGLLDAYEKKAIYRDNYTFDTFVTYEECRNENQIKNYYRRFGQLCAVIYMLRGNDIHYENIIAHGEYPVLIDVETLFQHQSDVLRSTNNAYSDVYMDSISSVGGTAMVPIITFSKNSNSKGVDISALNGKEQELPYKVLQLVNINTDKVQFEYVNAHIDAANNIPLLNGKKVSFIEYSSDVINGFEDTMNNILNNKDLFLKKDGLLEAFSGIRVRHLMKATQNYAKMMMFSSHPNYSSDMAALERMFVNVWNYAYADKRIIRSEVDDMVGGDIPIFYGKIEGNEIISSDGSVISDYFPVSAYDKVKSRIYELSSEGVARQVSQMKVCMNLFEKENAERFARIRNDGATPKSAKEYYLEKACEIADIIVNTAHYNAFSDTVEWCNVIYDDINCCWKTRGIGCGMVSGSAGVFAFLYLLNKYTGKYEEFLNTMMHSFGQTPYDIMPLSLNDGIASIMYSYLLVYRDNHDEKIEKMLVFLVNNIVAKMDQLSEYNLMYGIAGIAVVMCDAWKLTGNEIFKNIALKLCTRISEKYTADEDDMSFYTGVSGIVYAIETAKTCFSEFTDEKADALISKYNSINSEDKAMESFALSNEMMQSFISLVSESGIATDCFAGGNSGKLFGLLNYKKLEEAENTISRVIGNYENGGYIYPSMAGYTSVGFMYGLSGIGYSLLKYYNPSEVNVPLFEC